jgi:glucose/arabinose dehydrogenase
VGPDGAIYVTTGEHSDAPARELAQDPQATWGKVMRLGSDGAQVWTLGHRNVQGAAFDGQGRLWVSEMGPMGGDELNLIEQGANYGWPVVSYGLNYNGSPVGIGEPRAEGFVEPVYYWDPVIAPGGMDFIDQGLFPGWQGDLLIAGLQAEGLVRIKLEGDRVVGEERVLQGLGRVRDVEEIADGSLLILTDSGSIQRVTPG